jgi:hypothetical protein
MNKCRLGPITITVAVSHNRFVTPSIRVNSFSALQLSDGDWRPFHAVPQPGCDRFPGWMATLNLRRKGPGRVPVAG